MHNPRQRSFWRTVAVTAIGVLVNACGGGGESTAPKTCTVTALTVAPSNPSVSVGSKVQLSATISASNCTSLPVATWTSSAELVASVASTGEVTGVVAGSAVITATAGGISGTAALTVNGTPTLSVSSVKPAAGAAAVSIDSTVRLVFSAAVDPATVTSSTVTVTLGGTAVAGSLAVAGNTVTFKPAVPLTEFRSVYTVTATTGVKSTVGNFLSAPATSTFTTSFGDPNYFYQITNEFAGPTKALDTHSSTTHPSFLSTPVAADSGQFWYLVPISGGPYALLKNLLLGDAQALEGAPLDGQSLMTSLAPPGFYFSGQAWTFTAIGAPYPNGYRLQNQNVPTASLDVPVADASQVGLKTTGSATSQVWYFKRMNHR